MRVLVALVFVIVMFTATSASGTDCSRQLYDVLRVIEPFVPESAIPEPPKMAVLPHEPCDRECLQRFRLARLEEFKAKDVLLQTARSQMTQALQECSP